jgi:hypothetical protein
VQLQIEHRIDDLLSRMTIEEKVSQIYNHWGGGNFPSFNPVFAENGRLHGQSYLTGAAIFPEPNHDESRLA